MLRLFNSDCFFLTYSWIPISRILGSSKFPIFRTNPGFSSPVKYYNFTPDFANLPMIQTNLVFISLDGSKSRASTVIDIYEILNHIHYNITYWTALSCGADSDVLHQTGELVDDFSKHTIKLICTGNKGTAPSVRSTDVYVRRSSTVANYLKKIDLRSRAFPCTVKVAAIQGLSNCYAMFTLYHEPHENHTGRPIGRPIGPPSTHQRHPKTVFP